MYIFPYWIYKTVRLTTVSPKYSKPKHNSKIKPNLKQRPKENFLKKTNKKPVIANKKLETKNCFLPKESIKIEEEIEMTEASAIIKNSQSSFRYLFLQYKLKSEVNELNSF